jgi:hypothetical protein
MCGDGRKGEGAEEGRRVPSQRRLPSRLRVNGMTGRWPEGSMERLRWCHDPSAAGR